MLNFITWVTITLLSAVKSKISDSFKYVTIPADNRNIQLIGRYLQITTDDNKVEYRFDHPGCRIKIKVSGATEVILLLRVPIFLAGGQHHRFWVYIDGIRSPEIIDTSVFITSSLTECTLALGLNRSSFYDIQIIKITEAQFDGVNPVPNYIQFAGFILDEGDLVPPPALSDRRIEFLGDSITAGFCNMCDNTKALTVPTRDGIRNENRKKHEVNSNGYAQESFAISWPNLVCENLNCVCHTVAWSGFGIVRNVRPGTVVMSEIYQRSLASDAESALWDFSSWIPQVVVVNLGTNDRLNGRRAGKIENDFIAKYTELLNAMTLSYSSSTTFFLACGPMSNDYCTYVNKVIFKVTRQAEPLKAFFLDFRNILNSTNNCCWHPNAQADKTMADITVNMISKIMKWN